MYLHLTTHPARGGKMNRLTNSQSRRDFVRFLPAAGVLAIAPMSLTGEERDEEKEEQISTNEDLMREHGILKRVMLAYEEIIRRIDGNQDFPPDAVTNGTT